MKQSIAAVICVIFLSSLILIPLVRADWAMHGSDPSRNGVGTGNPVLTPESLWNYTADGTVEGSPVVADGVVYIGSDDGDIYALNANSGALDWKCPTGSYVQSSAAVANGVVYIGSDDNNLYALNAQSGAKIWNYSTLDSNCVASSPTVVGSVVYAASFINQIGGVDGFTGYVYAFNATNGDEIWNFTTGGGCYSSPSVVNGVVYIGSEDNNVYALNAQSGAKIWTYSTCGEVDSSPAIFNGAVYVGSQDGNLYALNAENGAEIWNFTTGTPIESSSAYVSGVVYVGSHDANLYALNATDGFEIWNFSTGAPITLSSPAVVNGVVYIASYNNDMIYALGTLPASSSNKLITIIEAIAAFTIITLLAILLFRNRMKTKPSNPPAAP